MKLVILSTFIFTFTLFSQEVTWKPAVKRLKKAEKKVMEYTTNDSLIHTGKSQLFLRWSSKPEKPYLLLIHGMGLNGSTMWHTQVEDLSKHFNLIIPDLIGYGKSTFIQKDFSPEFQAAELIHAIEKIGITQKIHVLGFSYGGLVASMVQKNHSEKVNKLIVCDSPVKFFNLHLADSMAKKAGVSNIRKLLVPENNQDVDGVIKAMSTKPIRLTPGLKEKVRKNILATDAVTKYGQIEHLNTNQEKYTSMDYRLSASNTIFMWGTEDGIIPPVVGENLHKLYPESKLYLFEGGKHDIHVAFTKHFNLLVIESLIQP